MDTSPVRPTNSQSIRPHPFS